MTFAMTSGATIFLVVVILLVVATILTVYTRRGSGIDEHPADGRGEAAGSGGPTEFEPGEGEELPGNSGTR